MVPEEGRPGALSVVSTGTSFGVITAAVLALAVTLNLLDWRTAWIGFGLCGLALIAIAHGGLPPRRPRANPASRAEAGENGQTAPRIPVPPAAMAGRLLSLAQRAALPLYGAALCFGMTNAIFLSFAADRVVDAGGLPGLPDGTASAAIFLAYGICGLLGLLTGRIEARIGLALLLCAIFAAGALSLILIALAPSSWIAVLLAASVHGVAIMMVSAVLSFWSLWLFPGSGTLAFTAALVCVAAGSVLGPAVAGLLAAACGHLAMFLAAAIPPLAMSAWFANLLRHPRPRLTPAVKGA
jgi:predicted MFS family arabinose efflux permease